MDGVLNTTLRFFLSALAVWRVSFMLAREDGPWDLLKRLRRSLGGGRALGCVKCLGLWISMPFVLFIGTRGVEGCVTWLALAGVVALIDEWTAPSFEWRETGGKEPSEVEQPSAADRPQE